MLQSLVKNLIQLVYSAQQRQSWIGNAHRDGLFAYQAGIYTETRSTNGLSGIERVVSPLQGWDVNG
jgi:hypothetical protein